jgi:hypothetical protein
LEKVFLATFSSNFVNPALNKVSDQRKVTTSALEAGLNIDISEGCPVHLFYLPAEPCGVLDIVLGKIRHVSIILYWAKYEIFKNLVLGKIRHVSTI